MPRLLASCVLVLLCACGGSSDDTVFGTPGAGGAKPVVCVAGKQEACACPTGGVGAQRCKDDSSGYGVCEGCVGGAGASGGAGSGASAGAGGGNPGGAGGSSGKGGASAGGSGGSGGGNCMEPPAKVAATTTLLLADRSGSMNDSNKWGSSVSAWNGAVAAAPPTLRVGLLRFPENVMGADVCTDISPSPQVPFAPLSSSASAITKVLGMTIADGASPVLWALKNGYAALAAEPGPRFVVLVTDFAPLLRMMPPFPDNPLCGEYADFSDVVTAAAAASTKTFVIALPGSEAEGVTLSQMAIKGGTAKPGCSLTAKNCHTQISVSGLGAPLTAAVADALQTISRCVFEAPAGGAGSNLLTVKVGGQLQVLDSSHQGGWSFFDDSGTTVQLYGKACEDAKSGKAVTISNGACALLVWLELACLTISGAASRWRRAARGCPLACGPPSRASVRSRARPSG